MPSEICSILYCTTGIILQKMQTDLLLSDIKVLILDEIHERSVETDLLMGLLKLVGYVLMFCCCNRNFIDLNIFTLDYTTPLRFKSNSYECYYKRANVL